MGTAKEFTELLGENVGLTEIVGLTERIVKKPI